MKIVILKLNLAIDILWRKTNNKNLRDEIFFTVQAKLKKEIEKPRELNNSKKLREKVKQEEINAEKSSGRNK